MLSSQIGSAQPNQAQRAWLLAAVIGASLVIGIVLYVVSWPQGGWSPWLLSVGLLYLAPVTLAALYLGRRAGLALAGGTALTWVPLLWRAFREGPAWPLLFGFIVLAGVLVGWTVLLSALAQAAQGASSSEADRDSALVESATLRVRQLATLNDIGKAVSSSLDVDVTLNLIMDRVQEALDTESGSLMLIENRKLVFHTSFGPVGEHLKPFRMELGQGIAGWVGLTGESILVADAKNDSRHLAEVDRTLTYPTRSILCVPLKGAENRVVGVLEVLNPRQRECFTQQDQELLESIAAFAVTAIQNARLYQQTLRYVTDLYALYEVGKGLASTLDVTEILSKITAETVKLTGAARSQIALVDPVAQQVTALVRVGFGSSPASLGFAQISEGLSGYVLREKHATLSDNVRRDERMRGVDLDSVLGKGARSTMAAPLLVQGEPVGVLCAIRLDDTEAFTDRELGVLNMLAGQASIAVENANNFEERKRRIVELSILNQTGQALSSTLEKGELVELIYHQVARVMDARTFYIALYDRARHQISFPLAYEQGVCKAGPSVSLVSEEWLPRRGRKGLTEHVLETRQALHLPDRIVERMTDLGIEQIGHPSYSWLGVPILWNDQPLGMIAVQSFERENAYDEGHVELLTTIASQAAVAMRNAQLFDQVNRMTENLETLVADRTEALAETNRELTVERDRLNALYRIMRELSSSLEVERLLNRTLLLVNHVLDAEQGYILIRDASNTLVYRAVVGRTPHTLEGESFASPRIGETVSYLEDQGVFGRLMSRPNSVLVHDLAAASPWEIRKEQARWHRSLLAAPLLSGEEARGCILLYHHSPDHFSHDHQRMLEAIAAQIAVTVSSLEIFDLLSESADRLGTMLRLQQLEAAKSQAILEGVADGVMVTDAGGRITLLNGAAERILRIYRKEMVGHSESELPRLFGLTGTTWAELARLWSDGACGPGQEPLYEERIEYEQRVIDIRIAPVFRQGVFEGTVSVFRDITKDVEVERMKSEFVSMVSHELRTPMTSIKGYIDLLHSGMAGPLTDSQHTFLGTVKSNADRLTLLVNSLLDISRLDTGMVTLALSEVNPLDAIHHVVSTLDPKATAKGQTIVVLAKAPLPRVRADPDRVVQILTNLVDNAVKYTPTGGQITIDARVVSDALHFDVQDDGMGISEQDQQQLFSRFFRAQSALMSGAGGAGLGLHITRSLVELHGGEVWVTSSPEQGSTFSFSLPLATREGAGDGATAGALTDAIPADDQFTTISYRSHDRHILLVEDEVGLAHQLAHHLRAVGGYRVHVSRYGRAALDYVREDRNPVDLIAVDLHLADMEGDELMRQLSTGVNSCSIPVIAIASSAESAQEERQRILDLGAAQFVSKPVEVGDLVSEIERVLPAQTEPGAERSE